MRSLSVAVLLALSTTACVPDEGPSMRPGEDCLSCHDGDRGPKWSVAGTVFGDPQAAATGGVLAAQVLITDATGRNLTLTTNEVGNFYTAEELTFPIRVEVQKDGKRMAMSDSPPVGSCNYCHSPQPPEGEDDVPGRLFVPDSTATVSVAHPRPQASYK